MRKTKRSMGYGYALGFAIFAWGGLLLLTYSVPPQTVVAFAGFFLVLTIALTCTFGPLAYALGQRIFASRRRHRITWYYALRQGALLSFAVVLNLILRALHSWNIIMALAIVGAAIIVEVLFLARK
ncbi:MAG TPA: hypothetical protein VFA10_05335 [Ktedonobacteraceae bacterium]|nr:hypothetical protein [Ktedonobacteraceae bacterium]